MVTIYRPPSNVKVPTFSFQNIKQYNIDCDKFYNELKTELLKRKKGKHVGEVIRFPVADGHAEYMVASLRPLELVHIPLGDAYEFAYIYLFTAKEVSAQITRQKAMDKLFSRKNDDENEK
jgi:hypothetical protein